MRHRLEDGTYVISARQVWRPGCFENKLAAWHGQRLTDSEIQELQNRAILRDGPNKGVITLDDIREWKA